MSRYLHIGKTMTSQIIRMFFLDLSVCQENFFRDVFIVSVVVPCGNVLFKFKFRHFSSNTSLCSVYSIYLMTEPVLYIATMLLFICCCNSS